ncbi:MAG: GspH/FimT family pseudopilin [Hyphomonadaceae bacterium]
MPISATGNNKLARDAGVTLVEALMALMVVGMMAGAVILLAPGPDWKTRQEAQRMAARAVMASEESIVVNRTTALVVTSDGYGFERLEENGWAPADARSPLGFRAWPEGLDVRVEQSASGEGDDRVARFDALGGATPARIVLAGAGARWRVAIDGQGGVNVERAD